MNTATRQRRLTALADALRDEGKRNGGIEFKMNTWGKHPNPDHYPEEQNYCGTAACALGTAALLPHFRRAGLEMRWCKSLVDYGWNGIVRYRGHQGQYAGAKFFGLTQAEAGDLFLRAERSRPEVIARIRRLARKPYRRDPLVDN